MEPCHYIFLFSEVLLKLMGGSIKNKNLYVCVFGNEKKGGFYLKMHSYLL